MGLPNQDQGLIGAEHMRRVHHRINNHDSRIEKVERRVAASRVVTALPTAPRDGQICYYQSAGMATLGATWALRYNASNPTGYNWESVGGGALINTIATSESTSATSAANLTTPGPLIVLPLAGIFEVQHAVIAVNGTAGGNTSIVNVYDETASAAISNGTLATHAAAINDRAGHAGISQVTIAAPSHDIRLRYSNAGAAAVSYQTRSILIRPLCVG